MWIKYSLTTFVNNVHFLSSHDVGQIHNEKHLCKCTICFYDNKHHDSINLTIFTSSPRNKVSFIMRVLLHLWYWLYVQFHCCHVLLDTHLGELFIFVKSQFSIKCSCYKLWIQWMKCYI